jgi:hypothetical protein
MSISTFAFPDPAAGAASGAVCRNCGWRGPGAHVPNRHGAETGERA